MAGILGQKNGTDKNPTLTLADFADMYTVIAQYMPSLRKMSVFLDVESKDEWRFQVPPREDTSPGQLDSLHFEMSPPRIHHDQLFAISHWLAPYLSFSRQANLGRIWLERGGGESEPSIEPVVSYIKTLPAAQREQILRADLKDLDVYTADQVRQIRFDSDNRPMRRQIHPPTLGYFGLGRRNASADMVDDLKQAREELMGLRHKVETEMQSGGHDEQSRRVDVLLAAQKRYESILQETSIAPQISELTAVRQGLLQDAKRRSRG